MRAWKYFILVAGLLGIAGFFAPFIEYRAPDGTLTGASAYDIVTGQPNVGGLMTKAEQLGMVSKEEAAKATRMIEQGIYAYRWGMIACFAPAALLFLVGLVNFARKKMGRLSALVAIILALGCLGVYVLFFRVDQPSSTTTGQLGLGAYLLAIGGVIALLGGLGALFKPEREHY